MIGQTISHYKIIEKLGEGGMGVVYKAHDIDLDRFVAIKGLPEHLGEQDVEYQRFMREARAASALNHPNVRTIHDFLKVNGTQYIVMEYVDGLTLREQMAGRVSVPSTDAIIYAIQIADALQEAHDHGVVHRDVKPANIMITARNQVKVMKLTRTDSTLGTISYMSPEQLKGGDVDPRSDLFSFGVVLYEMLTGRLPFRGEHEAALMYSIVNEEPEPLRRHLPDAPAELIRIVDRLLRKNTDERYQSAHEVADDLRRVAAQVFESSECPPQLRRTHLAAKRSGTKILRWIWGGATVVVVAGLVASLLLLPRRGEIRLNPNRSLRTLEIPAAVVSYPALSTDGNWLAYSTIDEDLRSDIYVFNIATEEPFRVTNEKNARIFGTDISPDMSQIVYGCQRADSLPQEIRLVSFHGGISRLLAEFGIFPRWNPNGGRVSYVHLESSLRFEIWGVNPDGTDNRLEFADSLTKIQSRTPLTFCGSPDGASIAWVRSFPQGCGEVMVHDLKRGTERQLTAEGRRMGNLIWTSNDRIIFSMNKSGNMDLWAMTPGGKGLLQITQGVAPVLFLAASNGCGRLVYDQSANVTNLWTADLNGGNETQVTFDDVRVEYATFSPDKKHIMAIMGDVDWSKPERHLFVMDPSGKDRRRLISGPQVVEFCRWSPDGNWLAYSAHGTHETQDSAKVYLIRPFDPSAPKYIAKGIFIVWLSSDEFIIPSTYRRSIQYSVRTGEAKQIPSEDSTGVIRMPGKDHLIIADRRKGREGIWTVPIDPHGKAAGVPKKVGSENLLSVSAPDLSSVLYEEAGDIIKMSLPSGKAEIVGHLRPGNRAITDVSADGRQLLIIKGYARSRFVMVENLFQ
jgi:serine/threonine protein kinase